MSTALAPSVTQRDDKGRKFMDIVGTAYDKAKLVDDEAQNVNDTPGLADLIAGFIAENRSSNKYKSEEVRARWGYPKSYKRSGVEQQIDLLRSHFPFLNPDAAIKYHREVYGSLQQPEWVEGPLVLIPTTAFKRHCFHEAEGAELLCNAVNLGLEKLEGSRTFYNWRKGQITPDRYRRNPRYEPGYDQLYATQPNSDFVIVGGQYGKRHGGRSMRRALEVMRGGIELPAGGLEGITMALGNPTRYAQFEELDTDLPADQFRPGVEAGFWRSPYLCFSGGGLGFVMGDVGRPGEDYGSVSFSVPQ
jgi:hypothetical protein